jgi:hypothetical protein
MKGFKQASQRGAGCGPGSTVESGPKTIRPGRAREVEGEEGRLEFLGRKRPNKGLGVDAGAAGVELSDVESQETSTRLPSRPWKKTNMAVALASCEATIAPFTPRARMELRRILCEARAWKNLEFSSPWTIARNLPRCF